MEVSIHHAYLAGHNIHGVTITMFAKYHYKVWSHHVMFFLQTHDVTRNNFNSVHHLFHVVSIAPSQLVGGFNPTETYESIDQPV